MEYNFAVTKIDENFHVRKMQKRDCFSQIEAYINETKHQWKICAVYGLRRTGKTTLLKQAADALPETEKKKALFIECFEGKTDFYEVAEYINGQIKNGYKYFFIDEITYADNFQTMASILSDKFVDLHEVKIVVTGTDSLGLSLSSKDILYDRMELVSTTYTTFAEYARITGITQIDDFIKAGSTLRTDLFDTKKKTEAFIETAIVNNILHSIEKSEGVHRYPAALTEKYTKDVIRCEIERMINRYSQTRTYRAIASQFKSSPLGDAREIISKQEPNGFQIMAKLKYKETNAKIAEILGCSGFSGMEEADIEKIYDYLTDIGVFASFPVYHSYTKQTLDEPLEMMIHPGMFHANLRYTLQELLSDSSWIEAEEETKRLVINKAYESAMGKIMENILLADVYYMLCGDNISYKEDFLEEGSNRWYVSKINAEINGQRHEADIIVYDKKEKEAYLFEVKHTKKNTAGQSVHLENEDFVQYIEKNFGSIKGRAVLYNGEVDETSFIPRISANKFLMKLYEDRKEPDFSLSKTIKAICPSNTGEVQENGKQQRTQPLFADIEDIER